MKPAGSMSQQWMAMPPGTPSGVFAILASASFRWKYSAKTPVLVLENFHPTGGPPDCDEYPAGEAGWPRSGVIAPTTTRPTGSESLTSLPPSCPTPTAS